MKYILNFHTYMDYLAAEGGAPNFELNDFNTGDAWYVSAVIAKHLGNYNVIFNNNTCIMVDNFNPGWFFTYTGGYDRFYLGEVIDTGGTLPMEYTVISEMLVGGNFTIDTSVTTSFTYGSNTYTAYKATCDKENRVDFWVVPYWYSDFDENNYVIDYHVYVYERYSTDNLNKQWMYIGGIDKIEIIEHGYDDKYTYKTFPGVSYDVENDCVRYNPLDGGKFVVTYHVESTEEETPILAKIHTGRPGWEGFDDTSTTIPALEIFESACLSDGTNVPLNATFVFPVTGEVSVYYTLKDDVSVTPQRMFGQDGPGGDILPIVGFRIPETIKFLGGDAFTGGEIRKLVIPDSIRGIANGQHIVETHLLTEIVFGSGLRTISNWGDFSSSTYPKLKRLTIKNGAKVIGQNAFGGCWELKEVTIPDSVEKIQSYAFASCGLEKITIGSGVTDIADNAFQDAGWIHVDNFINLSSLSAVDNNYWGAKIYDRLVDGVLYVLGSNLLYCEKSASGEITIPEGITSISPHCFNGCSGITKVNIPDGIASIPSYCFYGCSGMTQVNIPTSVRRIENDAFSRCVGLTEIVIPEGVEAIGTSSFGDCSGLVRLVLPSTITSLSWGTFISNTNLEEITCYAVTAPSVMDTTFRYIKNGGTLYYPSGSNYSSWLRNTNYYLGKYGWTGQEI